MFAEVKNTDAERAKYDEAIVQAQKLNQELAFKLTQKRGYQSTQTERLDVLVPAEINEVKILTDLSKLATDRNMLFGNVTVENTEGESNSNQVEQMDDEEGSSRQLAYSEIASTELTFSVFGTYEQFKSFLADIERSLVLMEITNISFTTGEGDLQQYEVTVNVFALPPLK
jgi:hypothetical protein